MSTDGHDIASLKQRLKEYWTPETIIEEWEDDVLLNREVHTGRDAIREAVKHDRWVN